MPREDPGQITAVARSFGSSAYRAAQVPYGPLPHAPGPYPFVLSDAKTRQTICNAQPALIEEHQPPLGAYGPRPGRWAGRRSDADDLMLHYDIGSDYAGRTFLHGPRPGRVVAGLGLRA
jgi:hypothetical protein